MRMVGRIFVNYRRDDSSGTAGRLHDRMAQAFGRKNLFMDVNNIPAGVEFVGYLNAQVAACDVFLAVIGPNWLDAKEDSGRRRLDNPADFVAVEIAAALARNIRVIPVMVDGARMPHADRLPESLKPLVHRNAVEVRNAHFGRDAEVLVEKVRAALKGERLGLSRWPVMAACAAVLLPMGWAGLHELGVPVWAPWHKSDDKHGREAEGQAQMPRPASGRFMAMAGALDPARWSKLAGNGGHLFIAGDLQLFTHGGNILMAASDTMIRQDFSYSIHSDVVSGPTQLGFGLIFGMDDPDNYFLFAKRTARDYRLTQTRGGQEHVILPWTPSDFVTDVSTPQRLQVVSEGPFVTLLVDGRRLQQVHIGREPAGSAGLFADGPGLTVNFSEISFGPRN